MTLRLAIADLGEVQVVSLHLSWPWPFSLPQQLPGVREAMAALPGPVIVAGDFNMQPWGASVSAVGRAARGQAAGRLWFHLSRFRDLGAADHRPCPDPAGLVGAG